jgi:ribonuclease R
MPGLFRIHEGPAEQKLNDLRAFLGELGLQLGGGDEPQAKHYARLLDSVRGRPDAHLIQTVMLRSLAQAMYSPKNLGHFGLAFDAYAHFTSPIRRYPADFIYSEEQLHNLGEHCSMTDRRADEATRDALDWLKCEYMLDKVGEEFDGIVTAVTSFGLFIELNEIYVEGLVHVTALSNDYYHHDPVHHRLVGERTGRVYRLADVVRVKVARVDLDERKIDFVLVDAEPSIGAGTKRRKPAAEKKRRKSGAKSKRKARRSKS